jgi:hypothetical protein
MSELEEAFKELRKANSLYSLRVLELESQLADLQDRLNQCVDVGIVTKLNEQLAEQEKIIERLLLENWEAWARFDKESKLLDEAVEVMAEIQAQDKINGYPTKNEWDLLTEKSREFLNKIKNETK